jgi:putative ABC transport system permease protein
MRFADLLGIAISALVQQKVRTLLTMAGVVIGSFALVVCVSLGWGFEEEVMRQLDRGSLTRQIVVLPGSGVREDTIPPETLRVEGPMSYAKRQRIRQAKIHRYKERRGVQLDQDRVRALARVPHVKSVMPFLHKNVGVQMKSKQPLNVLCFGASADNQHFRNRIVAGDYFTSDHERGVLVSEYLLYRWHITDDDDVDSVVGGKIYLEYRQTPQTPHMLLNLVRTRLALTAAQQKAVEKAIGELADRPRLAESWPSQVQLGSLLAAGVHGPLPLLAALRLRPDDLSFGPVIFAEEFTIVGVIREFIEDTDYNDVFDLGEGVRSWDADIFLPAKTAEMLFARVPPSRLIGYSGLTVTVDAEKHVKEVTRDIRRMGLHQYSLLEFVQGVRTNLVLITFVTAFLAAVALLVAALGIINTMVMTVLERTREIGVMKAVGARDRHIQLIFLAEGALIGLIGGTLGVFLAWVISIPGDSVARSLLQDQSLPALKHTLFAFPLWLTLGVPAFAGVVTTLAAVYPAYRATRINPIMALRHE